MEHQLSRRGMLRVSLLSGAALFFVRCKEVALSENEDGTTPTPGSSDEWASGGTAAMVDQASYPDPFTPAIASCSLICQTTEGPCTTEDAPTRQDVSEGFGGLPIRLMLKIVDSSCNPVSGATVEIWHTQRTGVYSGNTPNPGMCSNNEAEAIAANYFRGKQVTDASGVVSFDTCFPGWYSSRAIHIHFRVTVGSSEFVVSQLFFDESLTAEIFSTHPEYSVFGQPDTNLDEDNVIGGESDLTNYLLETARMTDGAMLASKVITVRSSTGAALCSVSGNGGPPTP